MAATIASSSGYPFIKLVSPDTMVGFSEPQKVAAINKVFTDSYKSPLSVIVVDNLERLLGKHNSSLLSFKYLDIPRLDANRAQVLQLCSSGPFGSVWSQTT